MLHTDTTAVKGINTASATGKNVADAAIRVMTQAKKDTVENAGTTAAAPETIRKNRPLKPDAAADAPVWLADTAAADTGKAKPDTLDIPLYYRESFFAKNNIPYTVTGKGCCGMAGDPLPYSIRNDNTITSLLILCFIFTAIVISKSRGFMARQLKYLFREPKAPGAGISETSDEYRFQLLLVIQTNIILSIISFLYVQECVADTFILPSRHYLMAIFFAIFTIFFFIKTLLYTIVNRVFFSKSRNTHWLKFLYFVTGAGGLLLYPLVLLQSYFDIPIRNAVIYLAFVVMSVKILLLYKAFVIFFKQKVGFMQIFLYFCTLEIMPELSLWGVMVTAVGCLKINI